jgi:uncharacterized protein (DUF2147 family)
MLAAAVAAAWLASSPAAAAESPVGTWRTVDGQGRLTSLIQIYEEDGRLFGKIAFMPEPNDASGKLRTCARCPGADRGKPILGLVIIRDMSRSGDTYKGGTIMDPEDGKVYRAEIWVEGGALKVRGYVGFLYRTETWGKAD